MWSFRYAAMDWAAHQSSWPHAAFSRFVQLPGQRWHVQVCGSGPVLLLLHGTGASSHSWRALLAPLAAHYTVVCPDLSGHAFTTQHASQRPTLEHMAAQLQALLQQLQLWPHAVVGHSAGAAIGAQLLLQTQWPRPALIALNPAWLPPQGVASWLFPAAARLLTMNALAAGLLARAGRQPGVVEALIQSTGSRLDAEGLGLYQRLLQSPGHVQAVLAMMRAWRLEALARALPGLGGPVLVHLGGNDRTLGEEQAAQACALVPQAAVVRVPGLGHLAHEEAPAQTSAHILEWLSQTGR